MVEKKIPAGRAYIMLWFAEIGRLLLGFMVLAILARLMTAEGLGTYLAVVSIASLMPRFLDLGLPIAVGYFLRIHKNSLKACFNIYFRHIVVVAPFGLLLAWALNYFPFESFNTLKLVAECWWVIGLFIVSELVITLGLAAFIPTNHFKIYLGTTLFPPLLFIALLGTKFLFSPNTIPVPSYLLKLLTLSSVSGSIFMIVFVLPILKKNKTSCQLDVSALYKYGLQSYSSAIAKILAQRFDRIFLAGVLGASGYAQYSLAISVRDMINFPANLYALTLRNKQIDLVSHYDDLASARKLLTKVSIRSSLIIIGGALLLLPAWDFIVYLGFGSGFKETAGFLQVLAFSCAPLAIMSFSWNHLYALNQPGRVTMLTVLSLISAIPIFTFFVNINGASNGAALAIISWSVIGACASFILALLSEPGNQIVEKNV